MRQLKFRGWDREHNCWRYGGYYKGVMVAPEDAMCLADARVHTIIIECGSYYNVDPATVGQFTGNTDKDGIEHYEGDITEWVFDKYIRRYVTLWDNTEGKFIRKCIEHNEQFEWYAQSYNSHQEWLAVLNGLKYTCSALDKWTTIVSNEFKLGETK